MEISIREIDKDNDRNFSLFDESFNVDSKLILRLENGEISYTIVSVPPYTKQYAPDEIDYSEYISDRNKTIFFAYVDNELVGEIRIQKYWNAYAYIDNLAVDERHRRKGVGRALMARAIEWAKEGRFPGIMLETQNNNLAACKLYESCGFELGGFDVNLYKALNPSTDEIALYWYLIL